MQYSITPAHLPYGPWTTARDQRVAQELHRMQSNLSRLIAADHRVTSFGPDPLVDQLLAAAGFGSEAFTARLALWCNGRKDGRGATAIFVLTRVWHQEWRRIALQEVKRQAAEERTRVILVPQRTIGASRRLASAKVISNSRHVHATATQRLMIQMHCLDNGWSTLDECASLVQHRDPVGLVLALVALGDLRIDRSRPIGPHSRIEAVV